MASGKQYKNVYTILEKVKKGEIKSHYKTSDGLFGKLDFYKKPDLIKPYLHYIDEWKVESIVESGLLNKDLVTKEFNHFNKTVAFNGLADDKKPNMDTFYKKFKENYDKFPKHIKNDIFKMYYNKMNKLDFVERTTANESKYKLLEKANNPVGKIMSEGSNLKSTIFTRNMMMYYIMQMTQLEFVDPQKHEDIQKSLDGNSDTNGDSQSAINDINDMVENRNSKAALERAMSNAQKTCSSIDEHIDKEIQEKMFENAGKSLNDQNGTPDAGKMDLDYISTIGQSLSQIKISMTAMKDKLKKLLDKSTSYFSSRKITTYDDLFNAQDVSGLQDYELLHPKLRNLFIEDVMIKDTKNVGKIDVYIDTSGSMSSSCGVDDEDGKSISRIQFAKSMVAKLKEIDMLNDVYLFDTRLKKYRSDLISIAMISTGGGTTIDVAVKSIMNNDRNGIIITDAEDYCSTYTDKVFFIGLNGARFNCFHDDVIAEYSRRDQVVVFNGQKIRKVDSLGNTIM